MDKRRWAALPVVILGLVLLAAGKATAADPAPRKADDLFGLTRVVKIHLRLSADAWKDIQPKRGGFPGPFGPPPGAEKPKDEKGKAPADVHRSAFGMEFPFVKGDIEVGGKTLKDVGVRFKGNFSYGTSAGRLRRPFKIDFNRYAPGQTLFGLKAINLSNSAADPTRFRETFAFRTFALAGVPSPRTAFAELYLTVPGKYDREYVGEYTLIENVDRVFLKDRFGSAKGLLLKPSGVRQLDYLGDNWDAYTRRYQPKKEVGRKYAQRLITLAHLVNKADDARFRKEIDDYLDVDEFLRFLAATTLMSSMDSFFGMGHNYYLYLRPDTNRFVFLPWDEDHSFGGMGMFVGSPDQVTQLSLVHPHRGENKLIDRILAVPAYAKAYKEHCRRLATAMKDEMTRDLPKVEAAIKDSLAREKKAVEARKENTGFGFGGPPGRPGGPGPFGRTPDLRTFVTERAKSALAQVDGKSKGYIPPNFGPGFGPPGGFGPGMFLARPVLEAADTNKDKKVSQKEFVEAARRFFKECDKDRKGSIDEKAIADTINRLMPRPPGFGQPPGRPGPGGPPAGRPGAQPPARPGPGGPPPGRPGAGGPPPGGPFRGFGPGNFLATGIVKKAGAGKDGRVSRDKFLQAAEALFREWDKDKNGSLDEKEITTGINLLVPPPQFGPPSGRPQPGRPADAPRKEARP